MCQMVILDVSDGDIECVRLLNVSDGDIEIYKVYDFDVYIYMYML